MYLGYTFQQPTQENESDDEGTGLEKEFRFKAVNIVNPKLDLLESSPYLLPPYSY